MLLQSAGPCVKFKNQSPDYTKWYILIHTYNFTSFFTLKKWSGPLVQINQSFGKTLSC